MQEDIYEIRQGNEVDSLQPRSQHVPGHGKMTRCSPCSYARSHRSVCFDIACSVFHDCIKRVQSVTFLTSSYC